MRAQTGKRGFALNGKIKAFAAAMILALCFAMCIGNAVLAETAFAQVYLTTGSVDIALSAQGGWTLSKGSVSMSRYDKPATVSLKGFGGSYFYTSSLNTSVVTASRAYDSSARAYVVKLTKTGVGKATVTVEDGSGTARTVSVTCKPDTFKLTQGNYTFSKKCPYMARLSVSPAYVNGHASDSVLTKVKSSNSRVAKAELRTSGSYKYALVTPKKAGKAKITYTDQYNRKKVAVVTVKKNYFKPALKACTYSYSYYGTKWMTVNTLPNAKVTVKIGAEKISGRADSNGLFTRSLKNDYRVGKKYTVIAKSNGYTAKRSFAVTCNTYVSRIGQGSDQTIWSCKNYVPVRVCNVHKGDIINLYAGGYVYHRHIYGNYSIYETTFYTKYTNRNYRSLSVTVQNKFGQVMCSKDRYLNW